MQQLLAGKGDELDQATQRAIDAWADKYRARLRDLSWLMWVLNESIARRANAEDEVTGRCIRTDRRGAIAEHTPRLLTRLGIALDRFIGCATRLMTLFGSAVGAPAHLTTLCVARQVKYLRGMAAARSAFENKAA